MSLEETRRVAQKTLHIVIFIDSSLTVITTQYSVSDKKYDGEEKVKDNVRYDEKVERRKKKKVMIKH